MVELIATTILFGSIIGMSVIGVRKIPRLIELPETPIRFNFKTILIKLKEKIIIINPFKNFSSEIFLQKIISKIRILSLRAENKTANWLKALREKSQKKKNGNNDNYWQELQKNNEKE